MKNVVIAIKSKSRNMQEHMSLNKLGKTKDSEKKQEKWKN